MTQARLGPGGQATIEIVGIERLFRKQLLSIMGDVRLLWIPSQGDILSTTDLSRNARIFTYDGNISSRLTGLGYGVSLAFNGSSNEADVPDNDDFSFGDGSVDQPFSIVALINATDATSSVILSKWDDTTGSEVREWMLQLDSSDRPSLNIYDESDNAQISRRHQTALVQAAYHLLVATYDGSRASSGINIYLDGAVLEYTDNNSGTYVAMENTAQEVELGTQTGTGGSDDRLFDGTMALVALVAKDLSIDEVWAIKEAVNGFFDLSL